MKRQPTPDVLVTISCRSHAELRRAPKAVLYHLESLRPCMTTRLSDEASEDATVCILIVRVIPIDPQLFRPEEACEIIRQTLAQSLTFIRTWECMLDLQDNEPSKR